MNDSFRISVEYELPDAEPGEHCEACGDQAFLGAKRLEVWATLNGKRIHPPAKEIELCSSCAEVIKDLLWT